MSEFPIEATILKVATSDDVLSFFLTLISQEPEVSNCPVIDTIVEFLASLYPELFEGGLK